MNRLGTYVADRGRRAALALLAAIAVGACDSGARSAQTKESTSPVATDMSSVRYVSPDGRDNWPGTESQPWRTLRRALPAMRPDQLLYVRGGVYREDVFQVHVEPTTKARPIVMMAYPGERVIVQGLFWVRQPSYWTIDGINVTASETIASANRPLVKITGGEGWTWQNSEVWGSRGSTNMLVTGYGRGEPTKWSVTGNCLHDVRPPTDVVRSSNLTIGAMRDAGPGVVSRNVMFDAPGPHNVAVGSARGGATDVTFEFNTVYGARSAIAVAGDTSGLSVTRNILAGPSAGVLVRWNEPQDADNVVTQNLGNGDRVFLRPFAEEVVGGPGNIPADQLDFADTSSCQGFSSEEPGTLPYGAYAVG